MAKVHICRVECDERGSRIFLSNGDELNLLRKVDFIFEANGLAEVEISAYVARVDNDQQ